MRKSENIRELEYLASSQWGMFTTAQAGRLGVGRTQVSRLAESGTVEQVRRGIYRYTVGEETSHMYAKAAWLACYPKLTAAERLKANPQDAVLACNTAAALHKIGDCHEDPYTFIVRTRRQTMMTDLKFHLWELDGRDVTFVDTLPVTTMERTVADLVRERRDPDHIMRIARAALFKGVDLGRLQELMKELGPSYDKKVISLTAGDILSAECEATVQKIVSDIMEALERRSQGIEFDVPEQSPMEQEYAAIIRRRIKPILEARAAEMEERRRLRAETNPADALK